MNNKSVVRRAVGRPGVLVSLFFVALGCAAPSMDDENADTPEADEDASERGGAGSALAGGSSGSGGAGGLPNYGGQGGNADEPSLAGGVSGSGGSSTGGVGDVPMGQGGVPASMGSGGAEGGSGGGAEGGSGGGAEGGNGGSGEGGNGGSGGGGNGGSGGGAGSGPGGAGGTPVLTKPNVLFVVFDDLNRHISPYGDPLAKTPNLQRFADRAVLFRRAYAQYPVCGPSRISFLSGLRPEQTKVLKNGETPRKWLPNHVFLPQHFKNNGYHSSRVGKVYEIGEDDPKSWNISVEGTPGQGNVYQYEEPQKLGLSVLESRNHGDVVFPQGGAENGQTYVLSDVDDKTSDEMIAQKGIDFIKQGKERDKPFFVAVGFRRPHLPWAAPKRYFDLYPLSSLPAPPNVYGEWVSRSPQNMPLSAAKYRKSLQGYYAALSFADAQFGRLLDVMDSNDLWKRTIVVVLGDHGYHLGSRLWWGKHTPYDEADATPLMIAAPGFTGGVATREVVELVDLYPTLVDLAGLPPRAGLAGRSLVPIMKNPTSSMGAEPSRCSPRSPIAASCLRALWAHPGCASSNSYRAAPAGSSSTTWTKTPTNCRTSQTFRRTAPGATNSTRLCRHTKPNFPDSRGVEQGETNFGFRRSESAERRTRVMGSAGAEGMPKIFSSAVELTSRRGSFSRDQRCRRRSGVALAIDRSQARRCAPQKRTIPVQYMLMLNETQAEFAKRADPQQAEAYWGGWNAFIGAMAQAGVIVKGDGLEGPELATTVRVRQGKRSVEDGPFADSKEQLGGYFVIEVPDLDAALAWATKAPCVLDGSVEVRPVLPMKAGGA